jgi:hypothetical protein
MSKLIDDFERLKVYFYEDSHITLDEFLILKEHECEELINLIELKSDKAKLRKLWKQKNYNSNRISIVSRNSSNDNKSSSCSDINDYNNNNDDDDFDYLIQFISSAPLQPSSQASSTSTTAQQISYESDYILVSSELMSEFNITCTNTTTYDMDDIVKDKEDGNSGTHIYVYISYILVIS